MGETLHPNLARLAARYDRIVGRFAAGQLDAGQARAEVEELEARDDVGLRWSIDFATGQWQYRAADGRFVAGEPPASGVATATGFHFSAVRADNPDRVVAFLPVEDRPVCAGPTRPVSPHPAERTGGQRRLLAAGAVALGAVTVAAAAAHAAGAG